MGTLDRTTARLQLYLVAHLHRHRQLALNHYLLLRTDLLLLRLYVSKRIHLPSGRTGHHLALLLTNTPAHFHYQLTYLLRNLCLSHLLLMTNTFNMLEIVFVLEPTYKTVVASTLPWLRHHYLFHWY